MSLPDGKGIGRRAALAAGLLLLLSGCGFAPVYGENGAGAALSGAVAIETPNSVPGFRLRTRLEDRLGLATAPRWTLSVDLDLRQSGVATTSSGETTRFNVVGRASYSLRDAETGAVAVSGEVESFTGYSTTGSTVAVQVAREDAQARLAVILADLILTRLWAEAPRLAP